MVCEQILHAMRTYQMQHTITRMCITNTQFYLDCVKQNHPELRAKALAVIVLAEDKAVVHLVVKIGNKIIDPSYDINSLNDALYFNSYVTFKKASKSLPIVYENENDEKWFLNAFMEFIDFAREMNNGQLLVVNKEYYDAQADYIKEVCDGIANY